MEQATVSSHDFNEDSLAGIYTAIDSLNWGPYSTRLILLVTDAGPCAAMTRTPRSVSALRR